MDNTCQTTSVKCVIDEIVLRKYESDKAKTVRCCGPLRAQEQLRRWHLSATSVRHMHPNMPGVVC